MRREQGGPTGNRKNKVLKNKNFVCIDFMHVKCVSGTQNSDVFFQEDMVSHKPCTLENDNSSRMTQPISWWQNRDDWLSLNLGRLFTWFQNKIKKNYMLVDFILIRELHTILEENQNTKSFPFK